MAYQRGRSQVGGVLDWLHVGKQMAAIRMKVDYVLQYYL